MLLKLSQNADGLTFSDKNIKIIKYPPRCDKTPLFNFGESLIRLNWKVMLWAMSDKFYVLHKLLKLKIKPLVKAPYCRDSEMIYLPTSL